MLCLNRTPTFPNLHHKGIDVTIICPSCSHDVETTLHAFRDCPIIRELWSDIGLPFGAFNDPVINIGDWIKINCGRKKPFLFGINPWPTVFSFVIWCIWLDRNSIVHPPLSSFSGKTIKTAAKEKVGGFWALAGSNSNSKAKSVINIKWFKTPINIIKLNTDDTAVNNPGKAAGGRVFRDSNGC